VILPEGFFGLPGCAANVTNPASIELCRLGQALADPINPLVFGATVNPKLDRYTAFLDAGFNITDDTEVFAELLFNRRETESQGFRQLFFSQFTGAGPGGTNLGAGRPSATCTAAQIALSPNCNPAGIGDPLNAGINAAAFLTPVIGVNSDNATKVDYYRAVGGIRSKNLFGVLQGWDFDSYFQYSRSDGDYTNGRILTDAVELQQFRSQLCPAGTLTRIRGVPCQNIDFTDPRIIAGNFTQQERDFLFADETGNTLYTQLTGEASVAGSLFRLPAGPLGIALGVHYRRDEIDDTPGPITQSGNVFGQSVAGRTAGFSESKEAFAELEVPLLRDQPLFQDLTLNAAARIVNSYSERDSDGKNDRDNGNFTYKLALNWTVNDWLRLRGSYGTSFRSPALFEQFLADQTSFPGQLGLDPCIMFGQNVANGSLPARIGERCAALGLAPDRGAGGTSSAVSATGGGIGVLDPETSTAKSLGIVFTPKQGPWKNSRVSLAVDYFDIEVKGQVTTLGPAAIVFTCFNADDFPNVKECSLFTRDLDPASPRFGQILTVQNPFLNINRQRNRGIDLTARLTQDLGSYGSLSLLGQGTFQTEDLFELFQGSVSDSNGEIGEPKFVGDLRATYSVNDWSLFYGLNYIGGISGEADLRFARGGGLCAPNVTRGEICPIFEIKPQLYHAVSLTRDIGKRFSMTLGVNNILNNKPPRVSSLAPSPLFGTTGQAPTFGTQYDLVGRRAFVSVRAKM
jgi:iron complex outermembrane receptor protein